MMPQIEEILKNYGELCLVWFDVPMTIRPEQSRRIYEAVKRYQPNCLINSRLGNGAYDYVSLGDNEIPDHIPESDEAARADMNAINGFKPSPYGLYESAATLNDTWGFSAYDQNWKSADTIVEYRRRLGKLGINYLLNVGPDAMGRIPRPAQQVLARVGEWLAENGASIYGCGMSDVPFPDWGRYTQRGNKLYLHLYEKCNRPIRLVGLLDRIERIRLLRDGSEIPLLDPNSFHGPIYREYPGDAFFFFGGRSEQLPDPCDTVIEITLKD